MTFPAGWPQGCPPSDAADANHTIFHMVKHSPPREGVDALAIAEKDPKGRKSGCPCQRCGLSVFPTAADLRAFHAWLVEKMPGLANNWAYAASATIGPEHGKIKNTPRPEHPVQTHHTWWPCEGVKRCDLLKDPEPL